MEKPGMAVKPSSLNIQVNMIPSNTIKAGKNHVVCSDILMLTADINYTYIHSICGKTYIVTKTIKRFEEMLEGCGFIRVNRSVIVNVLFIAHHTGKEIKLTNGEAIKIPRRRQVRVSSIQPA